MVEEMLREPSPVLLSINAILGFAYSLSDEKKTKRTNVSLALSLIKTLIVSIDSFN